MSIQSPNKPDFLYQLGNLNLTPSSDNAVIWSFDSLKPNEYKDGNYRLRRYSSFDYCRTNKQITLKAKKPFVQSDKLNQFQGNVARVYDDITQATINHPDFVAMLNTFACIGNLPEQSQIDIHQIRIIAKDNQEAIASPEGIHQDGFERIGMFTISSQNVIGGELLVWQDKNSPNPLITLKPHAGSFCILNDQILWHSAGDVTANDKTQDAYWDLFVLTVNCH